MILDLPYDADHVASQALADAREAWSRLRRGLSGGNMYRGQHLFKLGEFDSRSVEVDGVCG